MTSNTRSNKIPAKLSSFAKRHPQWMNFLAFREGAALFSQKAKNSRIMVAVPHHAPRGISRMTCDRNADENAGYLGCYLADKLDASLIVACNYFHDPNKFDYSDYFRFIEENRPELLIEIHGHGARSAIYDVEISSGPYDNKFGENFANLLIDDTKTDEILEKLTVSGDYSKIYFTAQYSITITDNRWHSLHIELPPNIRKNGDSAYPPETGYKLMDHICAVLKDEENKLF